jgi:hypothetical protein
MPVVDRLSFEQELLAEEIEQAPERLDRWRDHVALDAGDGRLARSRPCCKLGLRQAVTRSSLAKKPACHPLNISDKTYDDCVPILAFVDFELTVDQREIQAVTREFAQAEIEPHAADWDREHRFPKELFGKLAELGLMGACVPEEYGGAGADFLSYILVLEELSRADAGVGVTVAVHTSAVTLPILTFGTDEQRSRFVPPLARGELIGAFALTETEAGSDAG